MATQNKNMQTLQRILGSSSIGTPQMADVLKQKVNLLNRTEVPNLSNMPKGTTGTKPSYMSNMLSSTKTANYKTQNPDPYNMKSVNPYGPDGKVKEGWGVGYKDNNVSGGFNAFDDRNSLLSEIQRMNIVTGNRSKQGLGNDAQTSYLKELESAFSSLPKEGWGVGYKDNNVSGGFDAFKDPKALAIEIERMNTVLGNRSKQGLGNDAQTSYLKELEKAYSQFVQKEQPQQPQQPQQPETKDGWGVGYETPSGGKYIDYTDPQALTTEIERINAVIKNREAKGMNNTDHIKYLNNLQSSLQGIQQQTGQQPGQAQPGQQPGQTTGQQPGTGDQGLLGKYYDELSKYGFDFTKEYATKQAEAEAQALRDGISDAERRNATNRDENLQSIDNNLMNMADSLDRNYYIQGLNQMQNQVNSGMNGGVTDEQNLRMAMARQADMSGAYRDANLGRMQTNNNFTNNDLKYAEQLGTVNQQALANAESMHQNNLQRGFGNAMNLGQFDQSKQAQQYGQQMELAKLLEDTRRYDMEFGIKEGELTGNYLPSYMRGNPYDNPFSSGGSLSGLLGQYGIQTPGGSGMSTPGDMANGYSQLTGLPMGDNTNVFQEALRQKQIMEDPNATQNEKNAANKVLGELSIMLGGQGINPDALSSGYTLGQSLANMGSINQTQAQQRQNADIALEEGALTGKYYSPEARKAMDTVFTMKQNVENGDWNPEMSRLADAARLDLSTMGFNSKAIGADVSLSDALSKSPYFGRQTEEGRQFDKNLAEDKRQFDQTLELEKSQFGSEQAWREYTYNNMSAAEQATFEQDAYQFGEELAWKKYEMEYSGTLQQSMAQAELDAYTGFTDGEGGGDYYSQYKVSSPYGMRKDPFTGKSVMHNGVDIAMPKGAPIKATTGGTVIYAGMGQSGSGYGGYGNVVVVKDANGYTHQYSHLDSVNVKKGQTVTGGTLLGGAGSTGRSTGVHLEYMVKNQKGTSVNPQGFLAGSHMTQKSAPSTSKGGAGYQTYKGHMAQAIKMGVPSNWSTGMEWLVSKESSFNPTADNPKSTAYGYGQFLNSTRSDYEKKTGLNYDNPVHQLVMMAQYVKDRYGTPEKAIQHHKANGWY